MDRDLAEAGRTNLLNAVAILASPLEAQLVWLERIGTLPLIDELALEFDDGFVLMDQLVSDGFITAASAAAEHARALGLFSLRRLDAVRGESPNGLSAGELRDWRSLSSCLTSQCMSTAGQPETLRDKPPPLG